MNTLFPFLRSVFICLFAAAFMASCGEAKIEDVVKKAAEACPMDIGKTGKVTDISQNDSVVTLTIQVDEDSVSLDSTFTTRAKAERLLQDVLNVNRRGNKRLMATMVAQKKSLQYMFVGSKTGKTRRAFIPGSRMVQIVDEGGRIITDPDRKIRMAATDSLQKKVVEANKPLPKKLREGLLLEEIKIEGGYLVYRFSLDGMGLSIEKVHNSPDAVKSELLKLLPSFSEFASVCKPACLGLILRFKGKVKTKEGKLVNSTVGILVTPDELNNLKI